MKTLFLPLFFLIIFSSPAFCEDDPGFMWLEQMGRGHSMSSTAGKQGEKNAQKMDMAAMMKKAAEQSKNEGHNKKNKEKSPLFFLDWEQPCPLYFCLVERSAG